MRIEMKAPPQDEAGANRFADRSNETNNLGSIANLALTAKCRDTLYVYAGDHPQGFALFDHPLRGTCRFAEGQYRGLTTSELDALDAYRDEEAHWRAADALDDMSKCHEASAVIF